MRYRVDEVKLKLNENIDDIFEKLKKKLGNIEIKNLEIVKESIDARDKGNILKVYSVDFDSDKKLRINLAPDMRYIPKEVSQSWKERKRPVVVGFGPAGIFSALILAQAGLNPIVLERGSDCDNRIKKVREFWEKGVLDENSNVQFGEGGAGTFSDGKLTTGIKDIRIRKVLNEFVNHGAPKEILYEAKPHIGTDILRDVVKGLREEIRALGGDVIFDARVTEILKDNDVLTGLKYVKDGREEIVFTQSAIFAIGHSARDTFRYLNSIGISMEQKPFSIGLRVEHNQDLIDIAQYGKKSKELGLKPASYKINYRTKEGRGVYSFCMCPGGEVIVASSCKDMLVVNGMSNHNRDSGVANSAILVDVRTSDFNSTDVLAGIDFQEKYERLAFINGGSNYRAPKTTWKDFRTGKANTVISSLPKFAVEGIIEAMPIFGKKIKGFDNDETLMSAVETRSSSPVRIIRDDKYMSNLKGLYPIGEGAGYAGGIMSAAVDGIKCAENLIEG